MVLNLEDVKNAKVDAHFFVSIKLHSFHKTSTKTFWYYFQEDVSYFSPKLSPWEPSINDFFHNNLIFSYLLLINDFSMSKNVLHRICKTRYTLFASFSRGFFSNFSFSYQVEGTNCDLQCQGLKVNVIWFFRVSVHKKRETNPYAIKRMTKIDWNCVIVNVPRNYLLFFIQASTFSRSFCY